MVDLEDVTVVSLQAKRSVWLSRNDSGIQPVDDGPCANQASTILDRRHHVDLLGRLKNGIGRRQWGYG